MAQITIGKVRFSFANVFIPKSVTPGSEPVYSCSLLIRKDDTKNVNLINETIAEIIKENEAKLCIKGAGGKMVLNPKFKTPLKDGDIERPGDPNYDGCYYINANSKTQPGIVDKSRQPITDPEQVYSGAYGFASISVFAYNNVGVGVGVGLQHIMKTADGDRLDSRISADVAFGNVEDEDDVY
jgi:hypothetical protein